jgi:hypothetical protein
MPDPIGYRRWAIAQGYHTARGDEVASILNASDDDAHVELIVYYADREPAGPYVVKIPARRALQIHMGDLSDPETIAPDTDYSVVIDSDVPVVVQHSRIELGVPDRSMLSTIAYAGD